MNRDTVVASIIGFSLGLVAAILIWVVPHLLPKTKTSPAPSSVVESSEEKDTNQAIILEVNSPKNGDISKTKSIEIKGKSQNSKLLTISSQDDTQVITPANDGNFSAQVTLSDGGNEITVTSYNKNKEEHKELFVYLFEQN